MGALQNLRDEYTFLSASVRILRALKKIRTKPDETFMHRIEALARKQPDAPAIFFEDRMMSYRDYNAQADRYAHWLSAQGVRKGEVVALMMENRPEFLTAWLGILKAGGVAALINTNLGAQPLAHCINISGARRLVLGAELANNYASATGLLERKMDVWVEGGAVQGAQDLNAALAEQPDDAFPLDKPDHSVSNDDEALYIYTSGTTGNPKAAKISHRRLRQMMMGFACATRARPADRSYVVLPLYHSAGGVCAVGTALMTGGSVIVRRKFSASAFWDDVVRYQATLFQYIGELCRYLLNAPPHPLEQQHKLRIVIGNGLRPEIWNDFKTRFAIPHIIEFYGATEGNVTLVNYDGKEGAIGRMPKWAARKSNIALVRFDIDNEEPMRNADGFCIPCAPGEVGEALGEIIHDDPSMPQARFEGYVGKKETDKKILRNVFTKSDMWFRTGDLLKSDARGYFYFIDRIGDTFRWKGENVATSEVSEAISTFPGIEEANVYGVQVPGTDGRAGMVSVVGEGEIDLTALHAHLKKNLPLYAQPLFLRIQPEMEITVTFKHRKVELVKEGFNPETISDKIYFNDPESKSYVLLDKALHDKIISGGVRV